MNNIVRLYRSALVAGALLLLTAVNFSSHAASVTLDFTSANSVRTGVSNCNGALGVGGVTQCYTSGDTIVETFNSTGLGSAVNSVWNFQILNGTRSGSTNTFDVLINGNVVDSFSFIGEAITTEILDFSLSNTFSAIAGDTFSLSIIATSTVALGEGSWNWVPGGIVTLSDGLVSTVVPVPAALPLFGTGLAVMGFIGWRRKRKLA